MLYFHTCLLLYTPVHTQNVSVDGLAWNKQNEPILPDHVPRHAHLVLTTGTRPEQNEPPAFHRSLALADRDKLPILSKTPKKMQRNYVPLSSVKTIHLHYITMANVKTILHVFPNLKVRSVCSPPPLSLHERLTRARF